MKKLPTKKKALAEECTKFIFEVNKKSDYSQAPTFKKMYLRIATVIRKSSRTISFMTWRCSKLFFKSSANFYCKFYFFRFFFPHYKL